MVKSFSIAKKPRVLFGVGLTTEAPKELKKAGCKNIFVLSDPVLKKMGAFQPLISWAKMRVTIHCDKEH